MRLEENRDKYGDSNPNIMKYPSRAIKKGKKLLEELEGYTN